MELKATTLGKRMAQHPYDRVQLLNAGVKVSGDRHEYLIPFNQLLSVHCKRGLVWGELEFVLPDDKVVRLHGTEWSETQRFYHHLHTLWQQWSTEMSDIAAGVLKQQLAAIERTRAEGKWLTRQQVADVQDNIRQALTGLPMPTSRLDAFDNCRELWRECQRWLGILKRRVRPITRPLPRRCWNSIAAFLTAWNPPAQPVAGASGGERRALPAGAGGSGQW